MARTMTPAPGTRRSLQRGVLTIPNGTTSATATVTAVNPAKAVLRFVGCSTYQSEPAYLQLTSGTVITATRQLNTNTTHVSWELEEFY